MRFLVLFICGLLAVLISCSKDPIAQSAEVSIEIPPGFPPLPWPENDPLTENKLALGRKLFFDPQLSRQAAVSCASCHQAEHAFDDPRPKSIGDNGMEGLRNSQPLFNLGWKPAFFRDGGVTSLALTTLAPLAAEHELNFSMPELLARLNSNEDYRRLFRQAYHSDVNAHSLVLALAGYMRTLISGNAKYDRFLRGKAQLNPSEWRGMNLFYSDTTQCFQCHSGVFFSSFGYQNNGLYQVYADAGRKRITAQASDEALFMVPTLRNLAFTAPYMHDGSMATLDEVLAHYNNGGKNHHAQSAFVVPLGLNKEQLQALKNFLYTLSDTSFIQKPH